MISFRPMMKKILFSILFLSTLGFLAPRAYADCQPIYGGGQTCTSNNFTINKMVEVPSSSNFVDNLGPNDARFSPSQTITYKLIITNTGSNTIPTLNIVDNFPQLINFVSGAGNFDANSKTLSFTISNLGAGQNQTINLTAQAADSKTVPVGVICDGRTTNNVTISDNNGGSTGDSSQVCIQNSTAVLPATTVKTTPATGPEMIPLALLLPGALGGFILRRKSKKIDFEGGEK